MSLNLFDKNINLQQFFSCKSVEMETFKINNSND